MFRLPYIPDQELLLKVSYYEKIAHSVVGSPLQAPVELLRDALVNLTVFRSPDLKNIYLEERHIKKLFISQIQDGMNCLDIGAHLGVILRNFQRLSPSGQHVAFEALPYKSDWLKRKFPKAQVHNIALSEVAGELTFHYNHNGPGLGGLKLLSAHEKNEEIVTFTVPSAPLDEILRENYRVDFIKIEMEGAELSVLRSGLKHIQRDRPCILFECCKDSLELFGETAAAVYEFFNQLLGYDIFIVREFLEANSPVTLEEFERAMIYPFRAFNFFAVPR